MLALILMHNIDVMHQECNMGEIIISTYMGFLGKTKDNMKARQDLAELCNRPVSVFYTDKVQGGQDHVSLF
jgi:hypothetical protein